MDILKTTGIALSSHASGEADLMCDYYTREFGKRRFVFKGLKKSRKRSRSAAEPGAVASIVYYHRRDREMHVVNEFNIEHLYPAISSDLRKIMHLCYILETVEKTCGYDMPDESMYSLLRAGLDTLAKTGYPVHLSSFFILRLLQNHGILSDIHTCKLCGSGRFATFLLDIVDFRPVCGSCLATCNTDAFRRSGLLSSAAGNYMKECLTRKFSAIDHERYCEPDLLDILFNASLFIENYYHAELKSKPFIFSEQFR